jgi:catalase (peroxidase I)
MESKCPLWIICCAKTKVLLTVKQIVIGWPNQLRLNILHQNSLENNDLTNFNYAEEFKSRIFENFKNDIKEVITTSQDWWPTDYEATRFLYV